MNDRDDLIEPDRVSSRRRRIRWLSRDRLGLAVLVGLIAVAVLWRAATWELDSFAFLPGDAISTEDRVLVDAGAIDFDDQGVIYFTTVRSRRGTAIDWVRARFDDSIELRPADEILQGRSNSERRAENRQAMLDSQQVAEIVAFEQLGVDLVEEDGAAIVAVLEGTAADGVLEVGDVVVRVDGRPVGVSADLVEAVVSRRPGDSLTLMVRGHGGEETEERAVVLGEGEEGAPLLGVQMTTNVSRILDPPVDIGIDAGDVGGPSAGLAWTLAILDSITPGDLTGGAEVAVTGTIDINGSVGPIGGIAQKTVAVIRDGIDHFLVPEIHVDEAQSVADGRVEIIGVTDLDDALEALDALGGNSLALEPPPEVVAGT